MIEIGMFQRQWETVLDIIGVITTPKELGFKERKQNEVWHLTY